jgi:hypothetical protein
MGMPSWYNLELSPRHPHEWSWRGCWKSLEVPMLASLESPGAIRTHIFIHEIDCFVTWLFWHEKNGEDI